VGISFTCFTSSRSTHPMVWQLCDGELVDVSVGFIRSLSFSGFHFHSLLGDVDFALSCFAWGLVLPCWFFFSGVLGACSRTYLFSIFR